MTLYRSRLLDVETDPFRIGPGEIANAALRYEHDGALAVTNGIITARGSWSQVRRAFPEDDVVTLDGILLPGFVDTHLHLPQIRALGGLGQPLLDWLRSTALPAEERMWDRDYARTVARETLTNLAASGTTSALVFGSHSATAMEEFFPLAAASGLRITSGLVVSDTGLTPQLHTTPEAAYNQNVDLAQRWHGAGEGRLTYAVTPRFAVSCTVAMLEACAAARDAVPDLHFTSHINENLDEIALARDLHDTGHYVEAYDRHGLLDHRSVLAHNVHPHPGELAILAARGTAIAHCPTSNAALCSGIFPMAAHVEAGLRVTLGSDVGAGSGYWMGKEALQCVYLQNILRTLERAGTYALTPTHALWMATAAGAAAMGQPSGGRLEVGSAFDAVHVRPAAGSTCGVAVAHSESPTQLLARLITLTTTADVDRTWVAGHLVHSAMT